MNNLILITGVAGFVGHALAMQLLSQGCDVIGIDNLSAATPPIAAIRQHRLKECLAHARFTFLHEDIKCLSPEAMRLVLRQPVSQMVHLAANAGVREASRRGVEFIENNMVGFYRMIELARQLDVKQFIYASSSTIYGNSSRERSGAIDYHPKNLYAVTKIADELLAQVYTDNYGLNTIGLRFFSVYGPYGRPDMAPWIFAESIMRGESIRVANRGDVWRDFTYIDDLVQGIVGILANVDAVSSGHHVYDIGSSCPHSLNDLIAAMEHSLQTHVPRTGIELTSEEADYTLADMGTYDAHYPALSFTPFETGVARFCHWLQEYLQDRRG